MSDTLQPINCPACNKEMVKVFVPEEGINIDICLNGCGGIYFDNREFKKFDEKAESIDEILKAIEGKTFALVDESLPRTCPVCGSKMVKNYSSANKTIQIEECYSCGGKFLDNGELQKIRAEFDTEEERSQATMQELYNTVGGKLKELDEQRAEARANLSPLNRLFNSLIYGGSSHL